MKNNFSHNITLTALSFVLYIAPVLAQSSYRITIKNGNGIQVGQAFNSSININQLVGSIYQRIKPSGSPRVTITIALASTNLQKFQNLVKSKNVVAEYYEFPSGSPSLNKSFGKKISSSSIRSSSKNYGVLLSKSGYATEKIIPFTVTQITNNIPTLSFTNSKVVLEDERRIFFIVDTGNSGLDTNQISNAIHSKDSRLSQNGFRSFQAFKNCEEEVRNNPQTQQDCGKVNFVVNISR